MITCLWPEVTVTVTPELIVKGPTERPFVPAPIVMFCDTVVLLIKIPFDA